MFGHGQGQPGPLVATVGEGLQPSAAGGNHRQFGHGKYPVQQNEEEDDGEREEDHGPSGYGRRECAAING